MTKIIFARVLLIVLTMGMAACDSNLTSTAGDASQPGMTDSELESAIKTSLETDFNLKTAGIDVDADAEKKTVTLSGKVDSQVLRTRAIELARAVNTDLVITDKIDVVPDLSSRTAYTEEMAIKAREKAREAGEKIGDSLDDAWIHTKIVAKLIGNSGIAERKINVDVVNNVVTLRGTVETAKQKREAETVAKETDGVKSVKNLLKIKLS
ncbi:MAG: BON domain-containing protein [Blastocatellales bacterium]